MNSVNLFYSCIYSNYLGVIVKAFNGLEICGLGALKVLEKWLNFTL